MGEWVRDRADGFAALDRWTALDTVLSRAKLHFMSRSREIVLTFIVVVVGMACAASLAHSWRMKVSDAAAWAQAIGSVAAILATIAMTNRQINAVREGLARDKYDLANGVADAAQLAIHSFSGLGPEILARNRDALRHAYVVRDHTLRRTLDAFLVLNVGEWPSALLYARIAALQATQDQLWTSLTYYLTNQIDTDWPHLVVELRAYEKAIADFRNAYAGLRFG